MYKLCDYGCGELANFQLKNGKWCCSKHYNSCPNIKKKNSKGLKKAYKEGRKNNSHVKKGVMCGWENKSQEELENIYKKSKNTLRSRIHDGKISLGGHSHTEESKNKLSKKRIEFLQNNPNQNINWYEINGKKVQGNWEKCFAERLNELGIEWDRITLKYDKHRRYTPDFYLPKYDMYVEVKGFMRERDKYKMWKVLEYNKINIKMIESLDDIRNFEDIYNLDDFHEKYPYDTIDFTKFKNHWK